MEKLNEETDREVGEICRKLHRLSPDISINPQIRSAIRSFWDNVPAGLAKVKSAMVALRTAFGIVLMLMQPTGLFVQTFTNKASGDLPEALVVAFGYDAMPVNPKSGNK